MSYQDKWTRWHDKPTDGENYSSNNGWIYTAYAKKVAPETIDDVELMICYRQCVKSTKPMKIDRSPNDPEPPLSKDEVIGLVSLGLLQPKTLQDSHWNHCNFEYYNPEKLTIKSFYKAIKALLNIRKQIKEQNLTGGDKRNYIWKNKIVDAYPLAFRLPPEDIYYVKKFHGLSVGLLETIWFFLTACVTVIRGDRSGRMMLWLEMTGIHPMLAKLLPKKKYFKDYFGEDHPLYRRVNEN